MSLRRLSGAFLFVSFVLLLGFAMGCGGGGGQQDSGGESRQEGGSAGGGETSGVQGGTGGEGGEGSNETKMALGNIGSVKLDKNWFVLRTTGEGERMVFRLRENTRITLGGQEATPEDIEQGQQAQIRYVVRNERNQAREVTLFAGGGGGGSEGSGAGG